MTMTLTINMNMTNDSEMILTCHQNMPMTNDNDMIDSKMSSKKALTMTMANDSKRIMK